LFHVYFLLESQKLRRKSQHFILLSERISLAMAQAFTAVFSAFACSLSANRLL
jgi:hypothetical protein